MTPISRKPHDAGSHDQQMQPAVQAAIDAADKRMPAGCTTPEGCRPHGCHGACLPGAAETAIRAALAAGPTPGPWHGVAAKLGDDFGILDPHQQNVLAEVFSDIRHDGECAIREAAANAKLIAACNPAALAELLAELDGERNRSQMYADLVRGVAVVLHGEGWSDTSKLPAEVEALKADAGRYRWLRDKAPGEIAFDHTEGQRDGGHRFKLFVPFDGEPIHNDAHSAMKLDAAIDAAKGSGNG